MPFEAKIRPIDFNAPGEPARYEPVKTVAKSRFKRLFERQFMKASLPEKAAGKEEQSSNKKCGVEEFEPSSVCLARMVQNFMEDNNEKQRCGRSRCKCVNGECMDSSDDEIDSCSCFGDSTHSLSADACENLKSLVPCVTVTERNLLADTARIVDQNKITKRKDDVCQKILTDALIALGYDASICKSRWEKTSTCPAGEYEYVDVINEGERLIIDIDFRSEFEIARATKNYRTILQTLPVIFVGKSDRLLRIISIVTEAAKQSLKKKGMPFPPWRKAEYVKAKWLSGYTRTTTTGTEAPEFLNTINSTYGDVKLGNESMIAKKCSGLESELSLCEESFPIVIEEVVKDACPINNSFDKKENTLAVAQMEPPESKQKNGVKITGGLACIIEDRP